jgi:ABC-type multidrug transport system fused ATPase/permease subunit
MSSISLKQQLFNFTSLFKQLFLDYYRTQKKWFWLIQVLLLFSTATSLFWMLSIILGVSHFNNPQESVSGLKYLFFSWVYVLPIWQWLVIASLAGVLSAASMYFSFRIGVKSVLQFQKILSLRCLQLISDKENSQWTELFDSPPKQVLLRILKLGVQLSGLVARRVTRAFVPLLTFITMVGFLIYLNLYLLVLLVPLAVFYLIALFYINRYTSRVSTEMTDNLAVFSKRFNQLIMDVLNKRVVIGSMEYHKQYEQSEYMNQAELKYRRRLAEIHVDWLNTIFVVLGIAVIIVYVVYIQSNETVDWKGLLLFIIGLRFASSSLQQISATTVAFSRFLPEIVLLYKLLNFNSTDLLTKKTEVSTKALVFFNSNQIHDFEFQIFNNRISYSSDTLIKTFEDMKQNGLINEFKTLIADNQKIIVIDNKLKRLQQIITNHETFLRNLFTSILIIDPNTVEVKKVSLDAFLSYTKQSFQDNTSHSEMDELEY